MLAGPAQRASAVLISSLARAQQGLGTTGTSSLPSTAALAESLACGRVSWACQGLRCCAKEDAPGWLVAGKRFLAGRQHQDTRTLCKPHLSGLVKETL